MEQHTPNTHPDQHTSDRSDRNLKWKEYSIIEAIRAKGYEPDEIVVHKAT